MKENFSLIFFIDERNEEPQEDLFSLTSSTTGTLHMTIATYNERGMF